MAEGSEMGMTADRNGVPLGDVRNILKLDCTTVNILKTIELYALKGKFIAHELSNYIF